MKRLFVIAMMMLTAAGTVIALPSPTYAACPDAVLGIPTWYRGLVEGADTCTVKVPAQDDEDGMAKFITKLALNVVQILFMIVAYIAVFFIIKGGIAYISSAGSPDGIASAKKSILNAVIGLIISGLSASIVNLIAGAIR